MIFNYSGAASPFDPARSAIGQHNYSPLSKLLQQQPQALQQLGMQQQPFDPSAGIGEFERRQFLPYNQQQPTDPFGDFKTKQLEMQQQQPFDPSAGIGEFERRQFQPYNQPEPTQQPFDPSAGIGDFEARQFLPYQQNQTQPQALQQMGMRQQQPRQMSYQSPFQGRFGQMFQNNPMDRQFSSAYSYNNSQLNKLAPLNMNALNFSY